MVLNYTNVYANRIILDDFDGELVFWVVRGIVVTMSLSIEMAIYLLGGNPTQFDRFQGSYNFSTITNLFENITGIYIIIINIIVKILTLRTEMKSSNGMINENASKQIRRVKTE